MADINSLNDFVRLSNAASKGNGAFSRILGENNTYLNDIANMDIQLCNEMNKGNIAYKRISDLPKITNADDAVFYTESYNNWKSSADKRAVTKVTRSHQELSVRLGSALVKCCTVLKKANPHLNDAMEKNFAVKQMYRFDCVFMDLMDKPGFKKCVKIVGENVEKLQDCLFFYMLALMGINVILLQNKTDIDVEVKRLELSTSCVLGHLGTTNIPKFCDATGTSSGVSRPQLSQSPSVRMTLPPRPNTHRDTSVNSSSAQQGNGSVRVNLPPRPNTQRNTTQGISPSVNESGNVRVTLPPRQGSVMNSQQNSGGVRMTVPPRQSSSVNNQPNRPQQNNGGVRMTIPPMQGTGINNQPNRPQQNNGGQYNTSGRYQTAQTQRPQAQNRTEKTYEEIAQLAASIVLIYTMKKKPFSQNEAEIISMGSGIMIGENGYILTNCHVIEGGQFFGVRLENDEEIHTTNELVKYHNDLDLAVLRINKRLKPLKVYDGSKPLVRGQRVVAIGSPLGLFNTVSDGIISGFRTVDKKDMIQFTAPISNGSSGGAVLNMYGEVVGISTAGIDNGQNINLAVGYEAINNFARGFMY